MQRALINRQKDLMILLLQIIIEMVSFLDELVSDITQRETYCFKTLLIVSSCTLNMAFIPRRICARGVEYTYTARRLS